MRANLDATATAFAGTYVAGDMAAGTTPAQFSRPVDITDAQGGKHTVTLAFLKTGPNAWKGEIYAIPATDVTAAGGLLASGTILFNADGSLNRAGSAPAVVVPGGSGGPGCSGVRPGRLDVWPPPVGRI